MKIWLKTRHEGCSKVVTLNITGCIYKNSHSHCLMIWSGKYCFQTPCNCSQGRFSLIFFDWIQKYIHCHDLLHLTIFTDWAWNSHFAEICLFLQCQETCIKMSHILPWMSYTVREKTQFEDKCFTHGSKKCWKIKFFMLSQILVHDHFLALRNCSLLCFFKVCAMSLEPTFFF